MRGERARRAVSERGNVFPRVHRQRALGGRHNGSCVPAESTRGEGREGERGVQTCTTDGPRPLRIRLLRNHERGHRQHATRQALLTRQ